MNALTTESLITDRAGFGIVTASPAQRAACRIIDGHPLEELAAHPDVIELVGGVEALESLCSQRGLMPTEVVFLASIRSLKTIIACAAAVRASQTVDVSKLGPGEIPRINIVSLKLDTSAVAHRILVDTMRASPLLSRLLIDVTADTVTVRHPSGRPIEIACIAAAKAAAGLVARWIALNVFDEAPRMADATDAVVNLDHQRSATLGRLLPGGQNLYIGSPWAPFGTIYDLVQLWWAKPTENIVVLRGTGPMLNPSWWTAARCARVEAQDPVAYLTDVLGQFADPESGLLSPAAVQRNERESPIELPPNPQATYIGATDPSEGGASNNGFAACVVEVVSCGVSEVQKYRVAASREWRGLRPEEAWEQIAELFKSYRIASAYTDQYAAAANVDLARRYGLSLEVDRATASSKLESFTNLATLIHSDVIELPPGLLRRDLLSVRKRMTQTGATIVLPRSNDGRHADGASCLAMAMSHAADSNRCQIPTFSKATSGVGAQLGLYGSGREDYSRPRTYGTNGTHHWDTGQRKSPSELRRRRFDTGGYY